MPVPLQQRYEEQVLVQKCLAGDEAAWFRLVTDYRECVRGAIRRLLMVRRPDWSLVEDLEARVWEALWMNGARRLREYDPRRRLATFLNLQAWWQVQGWLRERKRQQERLQQEPLPPDELMARQDSFFPPGILLDEAVAILTSQEQRYLKYLCTEGSACGPCPFSDANRWKLDGCAWRKLCAFFGVAS